MEILVAVPILFVIIALFYALSRCIVELQIRATEREFARRTDNDDPVTCTSR